MRPGHGVSSQSDSKIRSLSHETTLFKNLYCNSYRLHFAYISEKCLYSSISPARPSPSHKSRPQISHQATSTVANLGRKIHTTPHQRVTNLGRKFHTTPHQRRHQSRLQISHHATSMTDGWRDRNENSTGNPRAVETKGTRFIFIE